MKNNIVSNESEQGNHCGHSKIIINYIAQNNFIDSMIAELYRILSWTASVRKSQRNSSSCPRFISALNSEINRETSYFASFEANIFMFDANILVVQ